MRSRDAGLGSNSAPPRAGPSTGTGRRLNVGLTVAKFKTRICLFFIKGECPFGERCLYAHGAHELQADLIGGAPAADIALNPRFKTRICKWWASGAQCVHGARCAYAHGNLELSADAAAAPVGDFYRGASAQLPPGGGSKDAPPASMPAARAESSAYGSSAARAEPAFSSHSALPPGLAGGPAAASPSQALLSAPPHADSVSVEMPPKTLALLLNRKFMQQNNNNKGAQQSDSSTVSEADASSLTHSFSSLSLSKAGGSGDSSISGGGHYQSPTGDINSNRHSSQGAAPLASLFSSASPLGPERARDDSGFKPASQRVPAPYSSQISYSNDILGRQQLPKSSSLPAQHQLQQQQRQHQHYQQQQQQPQQQHYQQQQQQPQQQQQQQQQQPQQQQQQHHSYYNSPDNFESANLLRSSTSQHQGQQPQRHPMHQQQPLNYQQQQSIQHQHHHHQQQQQQLLQQQQQRRQAPPPPPHPFPSPLTDAADRYVDATMALNMAQQFQHQSPPRQQPQQRPMYRQDDLAQLRQLHSTGGSSAQSWPTGKSPEDYATWRP